MSVFGRVFVFEIGRRPIPSDNSKSTILLISVLKLLLWPQIVPQEVLPVKIEYIPQTMLLVRSRMFLRHGEMAHSLILASPCIRKHSGTMSYTKSKIERRRSR